MQGSHNQFVVQQGGAIERLPHFFDRTDMTP